MAGKSKQTKKGMKGIPGKSTVNNGTPEYKPSLYLDGNQIPKELAGAKPGTKVTMTVEAKVTRSSQSLDGNSVSVELNKMKLDKPKG